MQVPRITQIRKLFTNNSFVKWRVLFFEALGICFLILWCWFDEVLDLPALLFGAARSEANIIEAIEESVVIGIFGLFIMITSFRLLSRVEQLEGIVPTCSFCKKVRVEDEWHNIEEYLSERSELKFSHGFCPPCMKEHYGISDT